LDSFWGKVHSVPLSDESRLMQNKYWIYQFGKIHQAFINANINSSTPSQALSDCMEMFNNSDRNDRILAFFNNNGDGGHAVDPYRIERNESNHDIKYIYVYDNNFPGEDTWRFEINTVTDTWSYDGQPGWGGTGKIFLMDPVGEYMVNPTLPSYIPPKGRWISETDDLSNYIEVYVNSSVDALFESSLGTIGRQNGLPFSTLADGVPIIPLTGQETPPIGYFLPNESWNIEISGVTDSLFSLTIFTDSTILSYLRNGINSSDSEELNYAGNDSALLVYNYSVDTRSITLEKISIFPDSEIVCGLSNMILGSQDSSRFSITPLSGIEIANYGDSSRYDLNIQISSLNNDSIFFHENILLGINSLHKIDPDPQGFIQDTTVITVSISPME